MMRLSRREFLHVLGSTLLFARVSRSEERLNSKLVKRVVSAPEGCYFTYPHSNGFLPDGRAVLAQPSLLSGRPALTYLGFDPVSGDSEPLAQLTGVRMYYAISNSGLMVVPRKFGAVAIDLSHRNSKPFELFSENGWTVAGDCDISPVGNLALFSRSHYDDPRMDRMEIFDLAKGEMRTIVEPGWQVDHAHFSPFDPKWICFCNNDAKQYRRTWVWNESSAPNGKHLFEQKLSDGSIFVLSHERAMFNKRAMITIAHGSSSATPRGLYEVGFDGSVRLISQSNRDFHCNISRDGRWAVVSLQGTQNLNGDRPERNWLHSDISYGESDVELVNMKNGRRLFFFRGTNASEGQPYEVQPTISPDGRWVLLKDARTHSVLFLEINQAELNGFLT